MRVDSSADSSDVDMLLDDAANNFLGYNVSTGGGSSGSSTRKRCFKKYATDSIHSRRVLLVVAAQVCISCAC